MTQPRFGRTPTALVPQAGARAARRAGVVPPAQVPARLTHRIPDARAPEAANLALIGSHEIGGPELAGAPCAPLVIASPRRGSGWANRTGGCAAAAHCALRLPSLDRRS
jgi:hypothetical protein